MRAGYDIPCQIKGAIATASVHIAIFSPTYAKSRWCLQELDLMLKSDAPILPVFYHVDPGDLRWTSGKDRVYDRFLGYIGWTGNNGAYAEALRIHEMKRRYDPQTLAEWRGALSKVSQLSGLELKECNRLEF
jgi:hypothetical protein